MIALCHRRFQLIDLIRSGRSARRESLAPVCGMSPKQLRAVFLIPWPGQRFVARRTTVDRSERCITAVWRYPRRADGKQSTVRVPDRKDVETKGNQQRHFPYSATEDECPDLQVVANRGERRPMPCCGRQAGGHWFEPSTAHFCCRFDNELYARMKAMASCPVRPVQPGARAASDRVPRMSQGGRVWRAPPARSRRPPRRFQ